jgi:hypothetical protein
MRIAGASKRADIADSKMGVFTDRIGGIILPPTAIPG